MIAGDGDDRRPGGTISFENQGRRTLRYSLPHHRAAKSDGAGPRSGRHGREGPEACPPRRAGPPAQISCPAPENVTSVTWVLSRSSWFQRENTHIFYENLGSI